MRFKKRKNLSAYNPHNKVQLLRGGKDFFDRLEKLIDAAEKIIHFQVYIFDADETGSRIAEALIRAAERDVKIYLLLDGYASNDLPKEFIAKLTDAGIAFRWFEPFFNSDSFYFGRRLHHKVIVIDEFYSFVAGVNISNRYNDIENIPAWLDFGVYVEGQSSVTLHSICQKVWGKRKEKNKLRNVEKKIHFVNNNKNHNDLVRVRRNDWARGKNEISRSYIEMLNTAEKSITFMSSYFLPSHILRLRMRAAVKRGVKIRVILAGISDIVLSKYAARYLYAWMLRHGIEIYEYQKTVLHAKVAICDDKWLTIGSYNVNNLSAYASIELNLDIKSEKLLNSMNEILGDIITKDCVKITVENYQKRKHIGGAIAEWGSYTIGRFLLFLFTNNLKQEMEK